MSNLAPTAKLRWVEREVPGVEGGIPSYTTRTLQQLWLPDVPSYLQNDRDGEWRDVPVLRA